MSDENKKVISMEVEQTVVSQSVSATFFLLRRGITRPGIKERLSTNWYEKVGVGSIKVTENLENSDALVLQRLETIPNSSKVIKPGEQITWYMIKKEADGWHVDGEIKEQEESSKQTVAFYYLLKRGKKRPGTGDKYSSNDFTKVGEGTIRDKLNIENQEERVLKLLRQIPSTKGYVGEGENVVWYTIKKEIDGWHVNGEIKQTSEKTAMDVVQEMKIGFNIGNTLESYSTIPYEIGIQARDRYQLIASYSAKPYDLFNSSTKIRFNENGKAELIWDLNLLRSELNSQYGGFGLQIFNFSIGETGKDTLNFIVQKAEVQTKDRKKIEISELLGEYSLPMQGGVIRLNPNIDYNRFRTTGNLSGGKLSVTVQIAKYLTPENPKSKELYFETLWNNEAITEAFIDKLKSCGFGAIRLPITYYNHIDWSSKKIDIKWLERIGQVVRYVLKHQMYCIINLHHEELWLKAQQTKLEETLSVFQKIWGQIARFFKSYELGLLFEGYNEIRNEKGSWVGDAPSYLAANKLNQAFVDTVRSSGGNNENRFLIVNTYAASINVLALQGFVLPADTKKNRLIVSAHSYDPQLFCFQQKDVTWGITRSDWNSFTDELTVATILKTLQAIFVRKGIPVIIGEFACWNKNNLEDRIKYASYMVSTAKECGITCFWWDTGGNYTSTDTITSSVLFSRVTYEDYFESLRKALIDSAKN